MTTSGTAKSKSPVSGHKGHRNQAGGAHWVGVTHKPKRVPMGGKKRVSAFDTDGENSTKRDPKRCGHVQFVWSLTEHTPVGDSKMKPPKNVKISQNRSILGVGKPTGRKGRF
jgi:hypothetical protein